MKNLSGLAKGSLAMFLLGTSALATQAATLDGGLIDLGVTYTMETNSEGYYQAPSNGVFTISFPGYESSNYLYSDPSHSSLVSIVEQGWSSDPINPTYDFTYNLTANQTVYFIYDAWVLDSGPNVTFSFTATSGEVAEPFSIVSMTPEGTTFPVPTDDATMPLFSVTLNKEYSYPGGQPPYWQIYNVTDGDLTSLQLRDFSNGQTSTPTTVLECPALAYEFYGSVFEAGKQYQFQMFLNNELLEGTTWTVEEATPATPATISSVNPTPGELSSDNNNWYISKFEIGLDNPDALEIDITGASGSIQYYVDDTPTQYTGTFVIGKDATTAITVTTNDTQMSNFLEAGQAAGADKWVLTITGVTVGEEFIESSSVDGCTVEVGNITVTYTFPEPVSGGDVWNNAQWNEPFTVPTDGTRFVIPSIASSGDESTNMFYLLTNSTIDLVYAAVNFLYPSEEMEIGTALQPEVKLTDESNVVYQFTVTSAQDQYYLYYTGGEGTISFTPVVGEYGAVPPAPATPATISSVNPTPGELSSDNNNWYISKFEIGLDNPDALEIDITGASGSIQYYVDDTPTQYTGTFVLGKDATTAITVTTNDTQMSNFLEAGQAAGADKWVLTITGVTVGDEFIESSSVDGCTVEVGNITVTYTYPEPVSGGDVWTNVDWNDTFTVPTDGTRFVIPSIASSGDESTDMFYLLTDSKVDLVYEAVNFLYPSEEMEVGTALQPEVKKTDEDNVVYQFTVTSAQDQYYLYYTGGEGTIAFTPVVGEYGAVPTPPTPEEPTGEEIIPETSFTVDSSNLVYYYTPSEDVENFYFKVDGFTDNKFTKPEFDGGYLAFSQNSDGTNPIQLSYVEGKDDSFYTGSGLNANTTYYIVGLGDYSYGDEFEVTLYLEKYEVAPSNIPQITEDVMFEVSTENSEYEFTNTNDANNEFYIVSNSDINLITENKLQILANNWNVFDEDVTAVPTENGIVYAGLFLGAETFTFKYTGTETIELTLVRGHYDTGNEESDFLNEADLLKATLNSEYPVVEITWNETVSLFDDEALITVNKNDELFATIPVNEVYVQLIPGGDNEPSIETRADLSDSGDVLHILLGAIDEYTEEGGAGTYTLMIPQGVFNNEDGKVNPAQSFTVEVVDYPIGTSQEDGANYDEGDNVVIMINFEGTIEENPENENGYVVMVYEGTGEFEATYNIGDDAIELVDETIVVKLGEALPEGHYQLSIPEGALLIDGVINGETTVNFSVGGESDAIDYILNNLDENAAIYNLNGMKLNRPAKGINIINGKKVIVR